MEGVDNSLRVLVPSQRVVATKPRSAYDDTCREIIYDLDAHMVRCHRALDLVLMLSIPQEKRCRDFYFRSISDAALYKTYRPEHSPIDVHYIQIPVGHGRYIFQLNHIDIDVIDGNNDAKKSVVELTDSVEEEYKDIDNRVSDVVDEFKALPGVNEYIARVQRNIRACHEILAKLRKRYESIDGAARRQRNPFPPKRTTLHKKPVVSAKRRQWVRTQFGATFTFCDN